MAAKKLLLLAPVPDQQQQMPIGWLNVKDRDLKVIPQLAGDLEVFAITIIADVERNRTRVGAETAGRTVANFESGSHQSELRQ